MLRSLGDSLAMAAASTGGMLPLSTRRIGSQLAQDDWVLRTLGYKRHGFFVEIGAHNGEELSNTVVMERVYSWRGICVEASPTSFDVLRQSRSCMVSNATLGDGRRIVDFCDAGELGGIAVSGDQRTCTTQRRVQTVPLGSLLDEMGAPPVMDYLSIDVEGAELSILSVFPFDRYAFHTITVEHNEPHVGPKYRADLRALLTANGYSFVKGNDDVLHWKHGPIDDFYILEPSARPVTATETSSMAPRNHGGMALPSGSYSCVSEECRRRTGSKRRTHRRVTFVSYGDHRYTRMLARIAAEARELGIFGEVLTYTQVDAQSLAKSHVRAFEMIQSATTTGERGGALLVKALIIHDALQRIAPGGALFFADAGCIINRHDAASSFRARVDALTPTRPVDAPSYPMRGWTNARFCRLPVARQVLGTSRLTDFLEGHQVETN
eukprot:5233283-Prymnesium_polylepis.1